MKSIDIAEFKQRVTQGCLIIDTRPSEIFCEGFIKNSISIPFGQYFVSTLQEIATDGQQVVVVSDGENDAALYKALNYSGIVQLEGFLAGGFQSWISNHGTIDMIIAVDAEEFEIDYNFDEFFLIDARTEEMFEIEHIEHAENIALYDLENLLVELETAESYYVYADTLSQAVTASSLFKRKGFTRVRAIMADFLLLKNTKLPFIRKKKPKESPQNDFNNN